jgi:hypothetical protein
VLNKHQFSHYYLYSGTRKKKLLSDTRNLGDYHPVRGQDRHRWRALVSTVMNFRVSSNAGNLDSLSLLSQHFEDDILALFKHVLTSTYFCYDGQFYEQTDGVAMGSPLSPVIANFFMEDFERRAIEQATHKPICWYRYVDDTFAIWPHGRERLTDFLDHLNGVHNNIKLPWK